MHYLKIYNTSTCSKTIHLKKELRPLLFNFYYLINEFPTRRDDNQTNPNFYRPNPSKIIGYTISITSKNKHDLLSAIK